MLEKGDLKHSHKHHTQHHCSQLEGPLELGASSATSIADDSPHTATCGHRNWTDTIDMDFVCSLTGELPHNNHKNQRVHVETHVNRHGDVYKKTREKGPNCNCNISTKPPKWEDPSEIITGMNYWLSDCRPIPGSPGSPGGPGSPSGIIPISTL